MLGFKFGSSYEIVYHQLEDSFKNYASGSHVGKDGKKLTASLNAYGFVFAFNWSFDFYWESGKSYLNKISIKNVTGEKNFMTLLDSLRCYYTFSPLQKEGDVCTYRGSGKKNTRDSEMLIWYGNKKEDEYTYELILEYKNLPQSLNAQDQYELGIAAEKLWNFEDASTNKFLSEAIDWWKKSDASGNPQASYRLGFYNFSGGIGRKNYSEAVRLFNKSLQKGNNNSNLYAYLGYCYNDGGNGIQKDEKKAFDYFQKGYKLRNIECARALSICYRTGSGCEKSLKKACEYSDTLFFRASSHDYAEVFCDNCNLLAYEYAEKQQYTLALKTLDMAITNMEKLFLSSNENKILANMYDSKGEIYLMMGKEAEALNMWNKVKEYDKGNLEFYQKNSELYKQLKAKGKI